MRVQGDHRTQPYTMSDDERSRFASSSSIETLASAPTSRDRVGAVYANRLLTRAAHSKLIESIASLGNKLTTRAYHHWLYGVYGSSKADGTI